MRIIARRIEPFARQAAGEYPVVTIVGPRQSGKTTLARKLFPDKPYYSLENPDLRSDIEEDPRGFLGSLDGGAILDEFQRYPDLTSYLQQIIDENPEPGKFILTGSRSLEVMDRVSQSLVGRSATVELLPFCYKEMAEFEKEVSITNVLYKGFYPPVHHRGLTPSLWFSNYVRNYLERDIRQLINIKDLNTFQRFLVLCAGRTGQLLNYSNLASELGVSHNTIRAWFSILEASYIVFFLPPYCPNIAKRAVKTPKLYFYDTGLASWLLSIRDTSHLDAHPLKGALFENYCVSEMLKAKFNSGERSNLYFWRDKSGHEIDVIVDNGTEYSGIEIKVSRTFNKAFLKNLIYLSEQDERLTEKVLIWGSDESAVLSSHRRISWKEIEQLSI